MKHHIPIIEKLETGETASGLTPFVETSSGDLQVKTGAGHQTIATAQSVQSALASGSAVPDWQASKAYNANEVVRATATVGEIDAGDIIRRNTAGTSGATFNSGEAANWTNLGADLVRSVDGLTGTITLPNATTSAAGKMSSTDKTKLDGIATGAEVNAQSDWSQATNTADDYIKNKPDLTLKEDKANKNVANGYSGLDANGKLSASQMPMSVITGISRAMPDNIIPSANLGIYLLADDLAVGAISAWDNKAGTTDFAQATGANQPIVEAVSALGNRLAAKFDGSNSFMETVANINLGNRYGLMAVIMPGATLNGEHPIMSEIFNGSTVEYVYGVSANQFKVGHFNGGWRQHSAGTPVNGTAYILVTGYDGSNLHIKLDGGTDNISAQTSDPTFTEASNIRLGRRWDFTISSGNLFHGHIAAVIAKKGAYFTTTEIEQLEGWAAFYYGLVNKLPANHRFKNMLPVVTV